MKTHYRPLGVPWRWIGLTLCVLAAVTQLTLSPSSRQLTWIFTTLAPSKPTTLVRGGSSGAGASSGSGGGRGYGAGCKGPTVGKPLDYAAAVKRYLSLPWTMRREGAKTVPVKLDANFNLSCFASPYVEGGAFARAGECVVDSIYYPSPPSKPATGAPDWSKRKMEKCAAAKAAIRRQPVSRATHPRDPAVKDERKDYIPAANITCGPSQLCYYPAPQPLDKGGFAEAVNTELGVEIGAYLPFFHYEASVGELAQSTSNYDSSAFYFWSARHCEWDPRVQRTANGIGGRTPWPYSGAHFGFVNAHVNRDSYPRERFVHPPWGPHYCGWGLFPFMGQRYAFIHNKRKNVEFMGRMVNTISPAALTQLYDLLKDNYVVVYQRPTAGLFKSESDGFSDAIDDITTLEEHAKKVGGALYVMPRLLKDFMDAAAAAGYTPEEVSLNEVQMTIIAEADIHISVQGGPAYMSMLWGADKPALLVQRKSPELPYDAVKWFDLLSGMPVETTYSDRDLVSRARDLFYTPLLPPAERDAQAAQFWGLATDAQRRLAARLRNVCMPLTTGSGGGTSRFELCLFRSAAQIVMSTEEVYMLGYWEEGGQWMGPDGEGLPTGPTKAAAGGKDAAGEDKAPAAPAQLGVAPGSDPSLGVPKGQIYHGGADCEGARGTPRQAHVFFFCDASRRSLTAPVLESAGEPSMCVYHLNVTLPGDVCFGDAAAKA